MSEESKPISESELRALRDRVFGRPTTNANWEHVKANWTKPESLQWLKQKATKPI